MELPRGLGKDNLFMPMMVCVRRFLLIIRVVGGILGDRELGLPENVRFQEYENRHFMFDMGAYPVNPLHSHLG